MRVYVAMLVDELAQVLVSGHLPQRAAHGVTPGLRALDPGADDEDLEFEAMCQALDAARSLGSGRRVVAAADAPEREARTDGGAGSALLEDETGLPLSDVVSFHVEEGAGSVGTGYDDLLWYDVTELSDLVRPAAR